MEWKCLPRQARNVHILLGRWPACRSAHAHGRVLDWLTHVIQEEGTPAAAGAKPAGAECSSYLQLNSSWLVTTRASPLRQACFCIAWSVKCVKAAEHGLHESHRLPGMLALKPMKQLTEADRSLPSACQRIWPWRQAHGWGRR